jgi:bacterioferritin
MKGIPEVIASLNELLVEHHSYFVITSLNAGICKKLGFEETGKHFVYLNKESLESCVKLIDRILFLDGTPTFEKVNEIVIPESIEEMLVSDKDFKMKSIASLSNAIDISAQFKDHGTRCLIEKMLVEEDEHLAKIEAEIIQHLRL